MDFQRIILRFQRIKYRFETLKYKKCNKIIKKTENFNSKTIASHLEMSEDNVAQRLMLGKLNHKILKTIKKLNRGEVLLKNKLKLAYQQLSYYLRNANADIENSDLEYDDIIQEVSPGQDLDQQKVIENNLKIIRNDLFANMQLIPVRRRYTMLTKIFSYCLYVKSKDAYNFMRLGIPLPCETILRETFGNQINIIEEQLTDINKLNGIIEEQSQFISEEKVETVLSIDAFSTTVLMKKENENKKENKNMFIYLLIPLKSNYKPIILHLE